MADRLLRRVGLVATLVFCAVILAITVKGLPGNPSITELNTAVWKEDGPFALSPERGRFALLYSLIEDKSSSFSVDVARFAVPDLGYKNGKYVSIFAPGVSFMAIPGYLLGKQIGISQVGTYAVISFFALLNVLLIVLISRRLGASSIAAGIAGLAFAFATPAFAYAGNLYQHHISAFLILLSIYALFRWNDYKSLLFVWFLAALSVSVDYPNFFMMLPIGLFALARFISVHRNDHAFMVSLKYTYALTFVTAALPLMFFLWSNQLSYGNPFQLAGTLSGVEALDENGQPTVPAVYDPQKIDRYLNPDTVGAEKPAAIAFFDTRGALNGFYILFLSPDRGIVNYAPIILLGFYGMYLLYRRKPGYLTLLLSVVGMDVLLYSLWSDPWGGWAFGARYLIPGYAILAVLLSLVLTKHRKDIFVLVVFLGLFGYSVFVNTSGALTSDANPPEVQVLSLEAQTGMEQKYTYQRNLDYLTKNDSESFFFQSYASHRMTAWQYFWLICGSIILVTTAAVSHNFVSSEESYGKV
ncbi:MAG: hypothetical protein M1370_12215 [Bacteroidetes bacterium]|nr:hypothetical protein [Bacteroidota bacterium]